MQRTQLRSSLWVFASFVEVAAFQSLMCHARHRTRIFD
jgi:hypothetical protein